jgi:hypothetical protein
VAEGDSVWLYADNGSEDDCPTLPLAVDLLVRRVRQDGDDGVVQEQREAVAALLTPAPSWESQQADEAGRETWDRVRRAGMCESEASRDGRGGVRTLYCSLRRAGVLDWFVEGAPVPVFLDGPHEGAELDLEAEAFGHYNPDFVRWAAGRLIPGPDRPLTRAAARLAYEPWRHVGRSYYLALEHLEANPSLEAELRDALLEATDATGVLWGAALEELRQEAWSIGRGMDGADPEWIPSITTVAAGFWIRRGFDGSRPAFREALFDLLEVVDPEFLAEGRAAERAR